MNAKEYYNKVVVQYLVENIEYLLENREPRAGLILYPVLSGVDTIGGLLYGFKRDGRSNSTERSKMVMEREMGMEPEVADFIFSCVRCGLMHQGTAKYGLKFFANHHNLIRDSIVYKRDGWVHLDVVLFAQEFVAMALSLENSPRLIHLPPRESGSFDAVLSKIPNIDNLYSDQNQENLGFEIRVSSGGIQHRVTTSMSPFHPNAEFEREFFPGFEVPGSVD